MERNDDLRKAENERAAELRDIESGRADADDEGYTTRDSLVRDDSLVGGRSDIPADRTVRATERVDRNVETVVGHDLDRGHSPTIGDQVGEAAGGIGGVLAGAAIGSIGGPIGTVMGGIAGAIGGWWTGRAISEAASNFSRADDEFRSDYESRVEVPASNLNRTYERVRPAYQLGYLASRNPEYAGRSFEDIEPHLERGWNGNAETVGSDWNDMRDYARTAYVRGAASQSSLTGDSSAKNSLSSTGTSGSVGIGSEEPHEDPSATTSLSNPTTSFAGGSVSQSSSSSNDSHNDPSARLASPKGSSFTRQGDVPLNRSATDSIGVSRDQDTDKQASADSGELRGSEPNRGPSFTDPVAGEGVENIGSSGLSPRGDEGTLNERVPETDGRTNRDRASEQY